MIQKKYLITSVLVIGAILSLGVMFFTGSLHKVFGEVTINTPTVTSDRFQYHKFFATTTNQTTYATSTTATSTNITPFFDSNGRLDSGFFVVAGAKKVDMYFARDAGTGSNNGTTTYKVQSSPDGSNWYDFNQLVQATSTSISNTVVQTTARIGIATTTLIYSLDLDYQSVWAIRCIVVEQTDGFHYCSASATF